eukprot:11061464-Alexandrium_andersonii.AAC.1
MACLVGPPVPKATKPCCRAQCSIAATRWASRSFLGVARSALRSPATNQRPSQSGQACSGSTKSAVASGGM